VPDDGDLLEPIEVQPRVEVQTLYELLDLITSFHQPHPRYMDTVALSVRPYAEGELIARSIIGLFDIDTAIGQALDFTGQWVGLTRFIDVLLPLVWFSFDDDELGFDQGKWRTPYEAWTEIIELGDEEYRTLLKARIVANHWDGTIPGAENTWDVLFQGQYKILLQCGYPHIDPYCHGDMKITQMLLGPHLDRVTYALFAGGYLGLKSAAVGLEFMVQWQSTRIGPSGVGHPFFGFDTEFPYPDPPDIYPPTTMAGFDHGHWGMTVTELVPPRFYPPLEDAPADGITYGRSDGDWNPALRLAGDTMEGRLITSQHPTEDDEAETRDRRRDIDSGRF